MDGMIAYRDFINALFPFCSCVKRKLQVTSCITRNGVVFLMSFYTSKVHSRPECKVRTVAQRKAYFHFPYTSGSSFSCAVCPRARALPDLRPSLVGAPAVAAAKAVWGKVSCSSWLLCCISTVAPGLSSQDRGILSFKQRLFFVSRDEIINLATNSAIHLKYFQCVSPHAIERN